MRAIFAIIFVLVFSGLCGERSMAQPQEGGDGRMRLTSPSFNNGTHIPVKFTGEGLDINPALNIEDLPTGTKSLALIVDDPDAPMKTWVHWVVYDIPPINHIDENSIPGRQGMNDSGNKNYHGPYPPSGTHRYYFKMYALNKVLKLQEGISRGHLEDAMKGNILSSAELVGLYNRVQKK